MNHPSSLCTLCLCGEFSLGWCPIRSPHGKERPRFRGPGFLATMPTTREGAMGQNPPTVIAIDEFALRRARAAAAARRQGLDCLLVCGRGGGALDRYADVMYLTNHYSAFPFIPDLAG